MTPTQPTLDDLLDQLVSEYSDRVAAGRGDQQRDLLERVEEAHRPALERCFRMIRAGLASPSGARALGPGMSLGGYQIQREIGRGGMAVVFEAEQPELSRKVALKVLRPGLAYDPKHVDRFRREALAVAKLQHPHIVQVFDVGEDQGHHFIVMELVQGRSLADVLEALPAPGRERSAAALALATGNRELADGGASFDQALARLLSPVVRAVGLAHELGMVHRDVKPSNILLHADGRAVIADFGLAKNDGDPALSLTGEPIGTPFYMSPEQAAVIQDPVDHRSDVYSFGVTLYEALTGRRPYGGENFYEVLEAIRHGVPDLPRSLHKDIDKHLEAVVRKAMARRPEERYVGALELSSELDAYAAGRMTRAGAEVVGMKGTLARWLRDCSGGTSRPGSSWIVGREYKSETTFLGWPLVHIQQGGRLPGEPVRVAKGWFAMGEIAIGGIALGGMSFGGVTFGGISAGLVAMGGMALGGLALGGMAAGLIAMGGCAVGLAAIGGATFGFITHGQGLGAIETGSVSEFIDAIRASLGRLLSR